MKKYLYILALASVISACTDDVEKWEFGQWPSPEPVTINGKELNEAVYSNATSKTLDLTNGQTITFTGLDDLSASLHPDFFTPKDDKTAVFNGADGTYLISYDNSKSLVYVEQTDAAYPDALWVCGAGWGHGASHMVTTAGWTWDNPSDGYYCRKDGEGIFTVTMYLSDSFAFKFFTLRWWMPSATEITANDLTIKPSGVISGNSSGDFVTGTFFKAGRYRIAVDMNAKTFTAEYLDGELDIKVYKVNGIELGGLPGSGTMLGIELDLKNGDELTFEDMGDVSKALPPHLFKDVTDSKASYCGPDGSFKLLYDTETGLIYILPKENGSNPYALWICGEGWGHPMAQSADCAAWNWSDIKGSVPAFKISENTYEVSLYLGDNFKFLFFKEPANWNADNNYNRLAIETYPANAIGIGYFSDTNTGYGHFTGDFVPGDEFTPGTYTLRIDTERNICAIMEKVSDWDNLPANIRKINDVELKVLDQNFAAYVGAELYLTQGQEMTFTGIGALDKALHPDFFNVENGKVTFTQPTGKYRLNYKLDRGIVYVHPCDDNQGLWITGQGIGHPCQSLSVYDYCDWGFDNPKDYINVPEVSPGVYQGTIFCGDVPDLVNWEDDGRRFGFQFQMYDGRFNWNSNYGATTCDIVNEGDAHIGLVKDFFNFLPLVGFTPGVYTITVDTNNHSATKRATVTFSR